MKFKKVTALGMAAAMAVGMLAGCGGGGGNTTTKAGAETTKAAEGTTVAADTTAAADTTTKGGDVAETTKAAASGDKVTLRVSLWDYSNTAYYQTIFDAFTAKYPNITIEPVEFSSNEYSNTIVVKLGAKENYDVVFQKGTPEMSALIAAGHLKALDDYMKDADYNGDAYAGLDKQMALNGNVYGIPFRKDNNLVYYNKDLFDAAGVAYPEDGMTMDDYRELAKKMTSGEGTEKVYGAHVHTWTGNVTSFCRRLGVWDPYDGNDMMELLPYYKTVLAMQNEDKSIQDYGTLKAGNIHYSGVFYQEQAAMMQMGTWYINMLCEKEADGTIDFKWGACSTPNVEGTKNETMTGGVTPVSIGAYAQHPDEAWEFIKFVTGEEGAKILASTGIVPGYTSQAILDIFDKLPEEHKLCPEGLSKYLDIDTFIVGEPMNPNGKAITAAMDAVHTDIMSDTSIDEEGLKEQLAIMAEDAIAAGAGK